MGSGSSDMKPQELIEFRKLNTSIDNVEIPVRPENRTVTDKKGFILIGVGIVILLALFIYGLTKSDLRFLHHRTDDCGNFCGLSNPVVEGIPCSGKDYYYKPYWDIGVCTQDCRTGSVPHGDQCVKNESKHYRHVQEELDLQIAFEYPRTDTWKFSITILVTMVLGVFTLMALRYKPVHVVWSILIFSEVVMVAIICGLWYFYAYIRRNMDPKEVGADIPYLIVILVWTLFVIILLIITYVLLKKIRLMTELYKEAVKVLAAMPLLIIVTISITIVQLIVLGIFYTISYYLFFSVELHKWIDHLDREAYGYLYSTLTKFTFFLNTVISIWVMYFVSGIHYMIISGSVARWFFAKNKEYLDSYILTSTKVTLKYHLGTVALGSLFIMLFSVVKSILKSFCWNVCCRYCTVIWCSNMEIIVKFVSENSYIQTAIHGQHYCKSAKRATRLLLTNVKSIAAINFVGDFVLAMMVFLVTFIATAISLAMFTSDFFLDTLVPTLMCLVINLFIVSTIFTTFQAIVDTLVLCFCEDKVLNDGDSRPYYMSRGLMQFVENAKEMYG